LSLKTSKPTSLHAKLVKLELLHANRTLMLTSGKLMRILKHGNQNSPLTLMLVNSTTNSKHVKKMKTLLPANLKGLLPPVLPLRLGLRPLFVHPDQTRPLPLLV